VLIPASVRAYVHDGGIRRAIRELMDLPSDQILEGLGWSELARFYRAQLAARQLESEWAVFALDLWEEVWGGLLDHWTALTPDEQMINENDVGLDLAALSDADDHSLWFGRLFTKGSFTFYASLSALPSSGLRLKVSCENDSRSIGFADLGATSDEYANWTSDLTLPLDREATDPAPLREIAAAAVRIADECIVPRRDHRRRMKAPCSR
jgi:hypothetical protein